MKKMYAVYKFTSASSKRSQELLADHRIHAAQNVLSTNNSFHLPK